MAGTEICQFRDIGCYPLGGNRFDDTINIFIGLSEKEGNKKEKKKCCNESIFHSWDIFY